MMNFWNIIVQSNTFNFVILVIILAIVIAKLNLPEVIEKIRAEIAKSLQNADEEKSNADKAYKQADEIFRNLETEIKEKTDGAKLNAKTQSDKILQDANSQVERIEANVEKVLSAEERTISSKLTEDTVINSLNLAKKHILEQLNEDLHQKFINDSIEELDKIW